MRKASKFFLALLLLVGFVPANSVSSSDGVAFLAGGAIGVSSDKLCDIALEKSLQKDITTAKRVAWVGLAMSPAVANVAILAGCRFNCSTFGFLVGYHHKRILMAANLLRCYFEPRLKRKIQNFLCKFNIHIK